MQCYRSGHSCSLESASNARCLLSAADPPPPRFALLMLTRRQGSPTFAPASKSPSIYCASAKLDYGWIPLDPWDAKYADGEKHYIVSVYHWYILSQNTCSVKPTSRTTAQVGMNTRQTCKIQVCRPGLGACSALSLVHCCWERYFRLVCVQRKYEKKQKCIMSTELNRIQRQASLRQGYWPTGTRFDYKVCFPSGTSRHHGPTTTARR